MQLGVGYAVKEEMCCHNSNNVPILIWASGWMLLGWIVNVYV
jgi:hypothetical protein